MTVVFYKRKYSLHQRRAYVEENDSGSGGADRKASEAGGLVNRLFLLSVSEGHEEDLRGIRR